MTIWRGIRFLVVLAVLGSAAGCASAGKGSGARRQQDVLSSDEMATVKGVSLYDVVDRLRPRWLVVASGPRSFGLETEILVYQGQTMLGGADILKQLSPDMVAELRYLDGARATASLPGIGSRHVSGAILIIPK